MFAQRVLLIVLCTFTGVFSTDDFAAQRFRGHVKKVGNKFQIVTGLESTYVQPTSELNYIPANGFWDQNYNKTGWSVLEIKTSGNQSDIDQAYSAGLLEGQLTHGKTLLFDQSVGR